MELKKVTVVLHRPSSAENIGAVARAMKNFNLSQLTIVAPPSWAGLPRGGGPLSAREEVLLRARKTARHASDLLEMAAVHADARTALAQATWICGTTSREIEGRPHLSPRELALQLALRSDRGQVAIFFGEERRGLSDDELSLCQAVCTIPTSDAYDSMNLAQSVAVIVYEIALAAQEAQVFHPRVVESVTGEPARHATLEALWARLKSLLEGVGYLNPQNPEHILAEWRRLLDRSEPTQREIELLLAATKAVERKLKMG